MRNKKQSRNSGFTMVEVLAAAAALIILLGLSTVAVVTYIHKLQITRLDNAAREIYMAAQNNAVLLSNEGRLDKLVAQKGVDGKSTNEISILSAVSNPGSDESGDGYTSAYYISSDDTIVKSLITDGSIEPSLWNGCFYVVYESKSGSVTDVFYSDEKLNITNNSQSFQVFYNTWSVASKEARMKNSPMIGHYDGGLADGERIAALLTPIVRINNGEKLTVEVSYRVPREFDKKVELEVNVKYKDKTSKLDTTFKGVPEQDSTGNYVYSYEWVLDSLDEDGPQFKDRFDKAELGGDFTVSAEVTYNDSSTSTFSREATNNSLFAYFDEETDESSRSSDGETAYISCLRHLQNLNSNFSSVGGKKHAVQVANVDCNNEIYTGYNFVPIQNNVLKYYTGGEKGSEFVIRNLKIEGREQEYNTGLFEDSSGMTFTNVRLVNASVKGGENDSGESNVGALTGEAKNCTFNNCWVYWERDPAAQSSLNDLLVKNEEYQYQIQGKNAGGLVGFSQDKNTFTDCLAATLVKGSVSAGGLIGRVLTSNEMVTIEKSYTDCYLLGSNGGQAAGFIGKVMNEAAISFTDCYAAGFIDMGDKGTKTAAGLFLGDGTVTGDSKNVYSVMRFPGYSENDGEKTVHYLYKDAPKGLDTKNFYYLGSKTDKDNNENEIKSAKSYAEMTEDEFIKTMGSAFDKKSAVESHPYNLQKDLDLKAYSFPGLASLPHYGDWGAQFGKSSLVYYEKYENGTFGFSGGNENHLSDSKTIVEDGYAIAILADDLKDKTVDGNGFFTVKYPSGSTGATEYKVNLPANPVKIDGKDYYLVVLPTQITNSNTADTYFYQPITYSFKIGTETTEGEYYFCPHFAKTSIEKDDMPVKVGSNEVDLEAAAKELEGRRGIAVRTPRHLYMLGVHKEYYHKASYPGYNYEQELPLDYSTYTGAASWSQYPIGDISIPFNGVYNGMCNVIKNVPFKTDNEKSDIGLFGYSNGTLQNIVLEMDVDSAISMAMRSGDMYVGALAGGNAGTVNNCAVYGTNISFTASVAGKAVYFGGLVGRNRGVIRNCAADTARFESDGSTFAKSYAGGLVGENELSGTVSGCYAVGRLSAAVDQTASASICGFVGHNRGSIERSYAAVDLKSSGANVSVSGFCGDTQGSQRNTYYLNQGNFTYRGESYNASYLIKRAKPLTYAQFTDAANPPVEGMLYCANTGSGDFPYPTVVRDADGNPVHYGQWPERMELGVMGVYYWEKLTIGGEISYNLSLLAVDPNENTITKQTTLSNAHSDGGVVTEFGYGYYNETDGKVTFKTQNINYMGANSEEVNSAGTVTDVDNAFKELMPGFDFHSYRSLSEKDGSRAGLYPDLNTNRHNGTFTLSETYNGTNIVVSFTVNPHFADALAVVTAPNGWSVDSSIKVTPGTENNPYEVRAIQQLQNINWNSTGRNTGTVINGNTNNTQFPYLSRSNNTEKYYWSQTHDLNGSGATTTPIAEYYDTTNGGNSLGNLYGWFGGTYDGDGYVIENLNIKGQEASCAGLFGVLYNGTLKDIILYSSDGNSTVTAGTTNGSWYAIGALAGVAATSKAGENAIENCAVAGYTINAKLIITNNWNEHSWGGGEVGGLVGISNMNLSGCSAVADVKIPSAESYDNLRIGGLVGSCQKTIENCYAGGSIEIKDNVTMPSNNLGVYIGGIVGGSYFKPLRVGNNAGEVIGFETDSDGYTSNTLKNCYSYVVLPDRGDAGTFAGNNTKIKALYAIGGTGEINAPGTNDGKGNHGICTMNNCYYLDSVRPNIPETSNVKTDIRRPVTEIMALTYDQLSGKSTINGTEDIYAKLTAFKPVTTDLGDGVYVHGKYSFPPSDRRELAGMDYPFPTILTREGKYHVHYGQWPMNGIERKDGAAPIELDIFTAEKIEEELTLTDPTAAGNWSAASADESIATAKIDASGKLTVTAAGEGTTIVTVSYGSYTLPITVNVTAVLELRTVENPVTLYTNDSTELVLTPYGKDGNELNLAARDIDLKLNGVTVNSNYITYSQIERGTDDRSNNAILSLKTGGGQGSTTVNISYDYTYKGVLYEDKGSTASLQISEPPVRFAPETVSVKVGETEDVTLSLVDGVNDAAMKIKSFKSGNSNVAAVEQSAESGKYTVTGVAAGETELVFEVDITVQNDSVHRVHHVQVALNVAVTAPENPEILDQSGDNTENV